MIFFSADFDVKNQLEDFYIKIDLPFITKILKAEWGLYEEC